MSDVPWTGLHALSAVAQAGSFRGAATALSLSPSALSHRIRGLEERLGLRVLHRTTRSLSLTPAGVRLLQTFDPAAEALVSTLESLHANAAQVRGVLRINASPLACRHALPSVLTALAVAHPRVQIELTADTALVDIVDGGFDAGVRFPSQLPADMIAFPIGPSLRFVIVASPAYLDAQGWPTHPSELHHHRCVSIRFPSGRVFPWEFDAGGAPFTVRVPATVTVGEALDGVAFARSGLGLAFCAEGDVVADLEAGRLCTVLDAWRPVESGFRLYYPSRRHQRAPLQALLDQLRLANTATA